MPAHGECIQQLTEVVIWPVFSRDASLLQQTMTCVYSGSLVYHGRSMSHSRLAGSDLC